MKSKIFSAIAVFCITFAVFADEQSEKEKMMSDPMMKTWMEYATPGEAHKTMSNLVGTWDTSVKTYMGPSPTESKGVSTFTSIMDGRYVMEKAEGEAMGSPFQGMGIYGYDNALKKYVATWVDNMGTGVMTSTGTSEDAGKTINWSGRGVDPMTGKEQTYRSAMHMMTADQYHFEMWGPGMDGKEMKLMEITYNRTK